MRQITFACQPSFEKFARASRRAQFLTTMDAVVPWSELEALPFPARPPAPAEAAKVKSGHGVPVRVPPEAAGAPMVRLTAGGELLALGILEPLGSGVLGLAPAEAAKVKSGHGVPVRVPPEAAGAPMVRLMAGGELLALGILEPLGRGVLALARPKIVLGE